MKLHELRSPNGANKSRKRVGRGHGSGLVKTAGRGTKGQKSRSGGSLRPGFEGGQNPIYRRMPYKRGFKAPFPVEYEIINLKRIEDLELESPVTPASLYERGVIRRADSLVKILGDGEIERSLTFQAHKFSKSAQMKIEAVGGTVEVIS